MAADDLQKSEKVTKPESMETTEELDAASGSGTKKESEEEKTTSKPDANSGLWILFVFLIVNPLVYF